METDPWLNPDNDEDIEYDIHHVISKVEFISGSCALGTFTKPLFTSLQSSLDHLPRYVLHLNVIHTVYNSQQSQYLIGFFLFSNCVLIVVVIISLLWSRGKMKTVYATDVKVMQRLDCKYCIGLYNLQSIYYTKMYLLCCFFIWLSYFIFTVCVLLLFCTLEASSITKILVCLNIHKTFSDCDISLSAILLLSANK